MDKRILPTFAVIIAAFGATACSTIKSSSSSVTVSRPKPAHQLTTASGYNTPLWQGSAADIWQKLQRIPPSRLTAMEHQTSDPDKRAWVQLAIISKHKNLNTQQLANALMSWRDQYPDHPANRLMPDDGDLNTLESQPTPTQIAVLLPESGAYGTSGRAVREGFLNAYYNNQAKNNKQNVKFYDTAGSQNMAALYQQAFNDGADFIVGPLIKDNVQQLSSGTFTVPVLALNYTDTKSGILPNNFYEYGLLPEDEAAQLAERAHEAGRAKAIIIAPQNAWGDRMVTAFTQQWQMTGGNISDSWRYTPGADFKQDVAHLLRINKTASNEQTKSNNINALSQLRRQDFDVVFLFSQPKDSHNIVPLLRYYYVNNNIPIYSTSAIYSGKPNPTADADLNGVIVCDIPWSMRVAQENSSDTVQSDRLYAVGQDAYLLSQSLQRIAQLPNFPIYGKTGALAINTQHQIHRRLPCVPIRNGLI